LKVLLSIKPEFAKKIFNGTKTFEYRRVIFKRKNVKTVVVYESYPIRKVVGEFVIREIIQSDPVTLWSKTKDFSGTTSDRFFKYFANRKFGYAIKIESYKAYRKPKSLDSLGVSSPPQSFRYLSD
jgi:predicted transcriptional regulator